MMGTASAWARRVGRIFGRTGVVAAAATVGLAASPAWASPAESPLPTDKVECVVYDAGKCQVTGVVYAITQVGGTTYIGGAFTKVAGQTRANLAAIGADGKLVATWNPGTDGTVYALAASDDRSTVYVGGSFTQVNGTARKGLAAVSATTGALSTTFTTTVNTDGEVRALAVGAANRLYVGGKFTTIGGLWNSRLASVDQTTGKVNTTFKPNPNAVVRALTLDEGRTRLYATGAFTAIGGQSRPGVGEIDAATGAVTGFAPTDGGVAIAADVTPSGRLFFSTSNNRVWVYDIGADNVPEYHVRTSGDVQAIYATDTEVYVGGHFSKFPETGEARLHMGSFLTQTGAVTAWNPNINGSYGPWAIAPIRDETGKDTALSVGGDFTMVNKVSRRGYARFAF